MAPSGRKSTGKITKLAQEDSVVHVYNFEDDPKKHLSGSDEDIREGAVVNKNPHYYTRYPLFRTKSYLSYEIYLQTGFER